ncbi:tetratricopeptide repeat protein [Streptomyces mangrovisoli]|uniref:tetratricopeptide repeat protein n=1 Tax=Streptomyces mangrovisoli TaxID=1428628 RepID=UPI001160255C|nr:tetratricopeptide repeat protein [Streptomyces mangrovisoli]
MQALEGSASGPPVVVVRGVSGHGKSRLLHHMRSVLTCPVRLIDLSATMREQAPASELDRHVAVGLAKALVAGRRAAWWRMWRFRRAAGLPGGPGRGAVRIVLRAGRGASMNNNRVTVDASRRPLDREAAAEALIRLARGSAGRGARIVMVDGCEWLYHLDAPAPEDRAAGAGAADWFAAVLLPGVLRAAPGLRFVLATREPLPLDATVAREVVLRPWHLRETAAFLRSCGISSRPVAEAVHRSCRGIPVWVAAVADAAARRGATADVSTAWILERARSAPVEQWLPRVFETSLSDADRRVLRAAAVLRNVRTGAVRAAVGPGRLPRGWDRRLLRHSFVRRYRRAAGGARWVLHPLVRTALLTAFRDEDPAGLVDCHERAAAYCARAGDLIEESYHRFAAGDGRTEREWRARLDTAYEAGEWGPALRIAEVALTDDVADAVARSLPSVTAAAASVAGLIAWHQHRHERAHHLLRRASRACADTGDAAARDRLLIPLADTADALQFYGEATRTYAEALAGRPEEAVAPLLARLAATAECSGDLPLALETCRRLVAAPVIEHVGGPGPQADVWNGLGRVLLDTGSAGEAERAHRTALRLSESHDVPEGAAGARCGLARIHHAAGRVTRAEEHFRAALAPAAEAQDATLLAEAWNGIGYTAFDRGEFDTALDAHRTALGLSRGVGDPYGEAEAWCGIGNTLRERSSPAEAEEPLRGARALYERVEDRRGVAAACCGLARVFSDLSRWGEAERAYRDALAAAEPAGDLECLGEVRYGLGHVARARGDDAEAEAHYRQALELFEAAEVPAWQCDVWNVMADMWARTSLERAAEAHARAARLGRETEYLTGELLGQVGLGRDAVLAWDLDTAERQLLPALRRCDEAGFVMGQLDALDCLGHLALIRADARAATSAYRKMLELGRDVAEEQRVRALLGLAEAAVLVGDHDQAAILATEAQGRLDGLEHVELLRADALLCLAEVALERDRFEESCALTAKARAVLEDDGCGDVFSEARAVLLTGLARRGSGAAEEAAVLLTEACAVAERGGVAGLAAWARLELGLTYQGMGRVAEARACARSIDRSRLHHRADLDRYRMLRNGTSGGG